MSTSPQLLPRVWKSEVLPPTRTLGYFSTFYYRLSLTTEKVLVSYRVRPAKSVTQKLRCLNSLGFKELHITAMNLVSDSPSALARFNSCKSTEGEYFVLLCHKTNVNPILLSLHFIRDCYLTTGQTI
jgi:hypothetical protein